MRRIAMLLLVGGAQAGLKFEVASIRPSPPIRDVIAAGGKPRIGTTISGRRVEIGMATPASIIRQACQIEGYQLTGPGWMNMGFDIVADMPEDSRLRPHATFTYVIVFPKCASLVCDWNFFGPIDDHDVHRAFVPLQF